MAPSIAARRLDGVRSVPAGAAPEMAAALETRARPLAGTFAARRGVRKGREDSLRRGDTSKLNPSTLG